MNEPRTQDRRSTESRHIYIAAFVCLCASSGARVLLATDSKAVVTEATEDAATAALLDEVIAGYAANNALIQHGTATYATKWTRRLRPPRMSRRSAQRVGEAAIIRRGSFSSETNVYFDYPRLRIEWRGNGRATHDYQMVLEEREIFDGARSIEYYPTARPTEPMNEMILIFPKPSDRWQSVMHPRRQLSNITLTEYIQDTRKKPEVTINASKEIGGLIRVAVEWRNDHDRYWVAPDKGYCVVRSEYGKRGGLDPMKTYEASVRQANNGAYVPERRTIRRFELVDGKSQPQYDEEATLVKLDLLTRPDDKLFTLDSLGIPVGARIQDRIQGREYQYAVAAVKEPEIKVPAPSGPMEQRRWATVLYIAVGVGLVAVGFLSHRFRRRAGGGSSIV